MKRSIALLAVLCAAVAAPAIAELPDAASVLARIQARLDEPVPAETNGPTLRGLFRAYLALPLNAPPAQEAEGWFAFLDKATDQKFDVSGIIEDCFHSYDSDNILLPFLVRLPSTEAWPAVRAGLADRVKASEPTNTPPALVALQFVFDHLAHDETAASNSLSRLRAAAESKHADAAFRQFERQLNRKGRLPTDVEMYFNSLFDSYAYISIPSAFLRLPQDRLWQLTCPVLTNAEIELFGRVQNDAGETPSNLFALARAHIGELAAVPGFALVDHTPAGRDLYESLLTRFDYSSLPPYHAMKREAADAADEDEDEADAETDGGPQADIFAKLLEKAQQSRPSARPPKGYGTFVEATARVLRGILQRDGLPAATDFAARFPTNFFQGVSLPFSDGCEAEMDFLERFILEDAMGNDWWRSEEAIESYVETAMRCGQTARARAKLEKIRKKYPDHTVLFHELVRLAAFDDDAEAIGTLAREKRQSLAETLRKGLSHDESESLIEMLKLLVATSNSTELVAFADLITKNRESRRWGEDYDCALVDAFAALDYTDKAFDAAVTLLVHGSTFLFYHYVLPLYKKACRHQDIVDLLEGDPNFFVTNALELVEKPFTSRITEIYAEALAKVGRGAEAAAIAREVALTWHRNPDCGDWPFQILADEMETGPFIAFMDALYAADRFEERPLIWKAEALRRADRLEEAEAVARKAVEVDPTDGETRAGDRIRSYAVLADILAARGATKEADFLRGAVKAVRLAEKGDELQECGLVRRSLAKYAEAEKYFSAAYCVQWRKAERLRELGLVEEAARHYEETFRQLPTQFGYVASLCFGCSGIFDSPGSIPIAERILTEAASGATPAPAACYLLGKLREEQERYDEAYAAYARATELAPDYLDAYVEQAALRFRVRRPRADWERIQACIFALDPLGRHSNGLTSSILDWGLAKRLESEALRKLPAPDYDSLRKIVFPASAAKRAKKDRNGVVLLYESRSLNLEERFATRASSRDLHGSQFIRSLSTVVDVLMGQSSYSGAENYSMASYDDFLF